jgi:DnaJ-class molecular chaperone
MNKYYQKDLYKILDITPESDVATIKSAYRKMARTWHPDVNDNSQESIIKFKEITEAYEVLTDTHKRNQYDILKGFNTKKENSFSEKNRQKTAQKAYNESNKQTSDFQNKEKQNKTNTQNHKEKNEENNSFTQVFENILDGIFTTSSSKTSKTKTTKKTKSVNGRDINLNINIKSFEAITGTNRIVNVLHTETCPKCHGHSFANGAKCPLCKGTGEVSAHKKLNVKIPANVKKGSKIRIANEGNKGLHGGKNGDLYLTINIEETPFFKYDDLNVLCEVPITPYEAVLGANIEVPTLCGNISMKIPQNTTTGQKFRLSEQGIYDSRKKKKGDQIVTVRVEIPKELSLREIELYEQLKRFSTQKIRENLLNE